MEIKQNLTTVNRTVANNKINKYIVIHYDANNGATAYNNTKYFKSVNRYSSAQYFVDSKEWWQSVRDEDAAWAVGKDYSKGKAPYWNKCTNYNSINIEMCSRKDANGYYFDDATVENTVELVKYLMQKYNIPIENVIRHYDVCGKNCPAPYINEDEWLHFKSKLVENEVEEMRYNSVNEIEYPEFKTVIQDLINKGYLKGDGQGNLDLSYDMLRLLVILHRAGMFN